MIAALPTREEIAAEIARWCGDWRDILPEHLKCADALLARLRPAWEEERDALRADVARLERQVNASVTKEVYAAQAETVTRLREDLRAGAQEARGK